MVDFNETYMLDGLKTSTRRSQPQIKLSSVPASTPWLVDQLSTTPLVDQLSSKIKKKDLSYKISGGWNYKEHDINIRSVT